MTEELFAVEPSPDGAWLAYITEASGLPQPWIRRLDDTSAVEWIAAEPGVRSIGYGHSAWTTTT